MNLNNIHSDWNEFFEENSETLQNILNKVLDEGLFFTFHTSVYINYSLI